jgi:hypothetical protein
MHAIMAAAFLVVLLVEWGSHSLAFAHAEPARGLVAIDVEVEHDDPCRSMTCCERRRSDKPAGTFFHDLKPTNSMIDIVFTHEAIEQLSEAPPIPRDDARRIFRPAEPPIHPPELS